MRQNLRSLSYSNPLKSRFNPTFFQNLPEHSGVYFMFDQSQRLLYIGKAKSLKHRITSYSNLAPGKSPEHILELIENITEIKWLKCKSEQEALRKENELLHAVRPPFNIASTE